MYTIIVTMIKAPFPNAGRGGQMTEKSIKLFFLLFSRILSNIVAVCRIGGGSRQRRAGVSCVSEVQVTSCLSWPNIQVMNWTQGATRHTSYNNTTSATTTTTLQWNNPEVESFNFDINTVINIWKFLRCEIASRFQGEVRRREHQSTPCSFLFKFYLNLKNNCV